MFNPVYVNQPVVKRNKLEEISSLPLRGEENNQYPGTATYTHRSFGSGSGPPKSDPDPKSVKLQPKPWERILNFLNRILFVG